MAPTSKIDRKTKGYELSGKTMLLIHAVPHGREYNLIVESEPHFWLDHRYFFTHKPIPLVEPDIIINDYELCVDIGQTIINLTRMPCKTGINTALLTILDYPGYPVIRSDGEAYEHSPKRKIVDNIPIPDAPWDDFPERVLHGIGNRILAYLFSFEPKWPPTPDVPYKEPPPPLY